MDEQQRARPAVGPTSGQWRYRARPSRRRPATTSDRLALQGKRQRGAHTICWRAAAPWRSRCGPGRPASRTAAPRAAAWSRRTRAATRSLALHSHFTALFAVEWRAMRIGMLHIRIRVSTTPATPARQAPALPPESAHPVSVIQSRYKRCARHPNLHFASQRQSHVKAVFTSGSILTNHICVFVRQAAAPVAARRPARRTRCAPWR